MIYISALVSKEAVIEEVQRTTSYVGAKMNSDGSAWDKIRTIDDDNEMLERFWNEATDEATSGLKRFLADKPEVDGEYLVYPLKLPELFDTSLLPAINDSLFSFYVMHITAKWFAMTNKEEAAAYAESAISQLARIVDSAYWKRRPQQPTY